METFFPCLVEYRTQVREGTHVQQVDNNQLVGMPPATPEPAFEACVRTDTRVEEKIYFLRGQLYPSCIADGSRVCGAYGSPRASESGSPGMPIPLAVAGAVMS